MNRHLLPEEIDLLLDGEEGFGVAPLRAHLDACDACREQFDALDAVVSQIESLHRHAPASRFAERVMAQVEVFEPWHVSLKNSASAWLPRSGPGRALALASGGVMAVTMSVFAVWLGRRADAVLFLSNLGLDRGRGWVTDAVGRVSQDLLGAQTASMLQSGGLGALGVVGAVLAAVLLVASGLRLLAAHARRRS